MTKKHTTEFRQISQKPFTSIQWYILISLFYLEKQDSSLSLTCCYNLYLFNYQQQQIKSLIKKKKNRSRSIVIEALRVIGRVSLSQNVVVLITARPNKLWLWALVKHWLPMHQKLNTSITCWATFAITRLDMGLCCCTCALGLLQVEIGWFASSTYPPNRTISFIYKTQRGKKLS